MWIIGFFCCSVLYLFMAFGCYLMIEWWVRRRFRMSLLTLWVSVIMVGILMALNFFPMRTETMIGWPFMPVDPVEERAWTEEAIRMHARSTTDIAAYRSGLFQRYYGWPILLVKPDYVPKERHDYHHSNLDLFFLMPINVMIAIGLISLMAYCLERRYKRKVRSS